MKREQLPPEKDGLDINLLQKTLSRSIFGRNIIFHETLSSTNSQAKALGDQGAPEGTLVLAEQQTAGRGRMGRSWLSRKNENLLVSLLLRPPIDPDQVFVLTMVLALAVIEGVRDVSALRPLIKWPNDLYLGGKKLAGILTEFSVKGKKIDYVILGLGLNVNWGPEDDGSILFPATSILAETGTRVSRSHLLFEILKRFEVYYRKALCGDIEEFYERWNKRSMVLGTQVEIKSDDGSLFGTASQIDRNGALIILDEQGQKQRILCGDVSLRVF